MRVLLAAEGVSSFSGVGIERYSFELAERLPSVGVQVCVAASNPSRRRYALAANAFTKLPAKVIVSLKGVDVVHATDPSSGLWAPLVGIPKVATFHDLMSVTLRSAHYGAGDRLFGTVSAKLAAKCERLIAVSNQTKGEMVEVLGVEPSKISVVHLGVSSGFMRIAGIAMGNATVGYVGDITPRKRIDILLRSFALVKEKIPGARLVIVGKSVAEFLSVETQRVVSLVRGLKLEDSVEFKGRVSDGELAALYNTMKVLVLPSEYEGFGLPIVEAERSGVPVVVRSGARIPGEVTAASLKARSIEEMAEMVVELIQDQGKRSRASEAALRHSEAFTWESCLAKTIGVYQEAMEFR